MASPKRTTARRTAARAVPRRRSASPAPSQKPIPGRDGRPLLRRPGAESPAGPRHARHAQAQPSSRLFILHRSPGITSSKVKASLLTLQEEAAIEFATPVLRDAASDTRQVLTDEIVLRLKPGQNSRTLAAVKAEHGLTIGKRNEFNPGSTSSRCRAQTAPTRSTSRARSIGARMSSSPARTSSRPSNVLALTPRRLTCHITMPRPGPRSSSTKRPMP